MYKPIIGLEIHIELHTKSKMFCGCKNDPFFASKPNIYTCPVCLGMPGALPVPNKKAVDWTIMLGLALGCNISTVSKFDRKHYFYPDLPKGYQISQYDQPLATNGKLGSVRIRRVHLEEDTAKLMHATIDGKRVSLIDFNRSGVPLVEIVTEPDIHSGEEAKEFLKRIHHIVKYLDISHADMEKGSMRLEPNISVQKTNITKLPPYKVEVKNINSFNFVKRAIEFEVTRQSELLEKGQTPIQENRGWNEDKGMTISQRSKEGAADYRYFPEPDIPPMRLTPAHITDLQTHIPELPDQKRERIMKKYMLSDYDVNLLTETRALADYFEACVKIGKVPAKKLANWIINKNVDINKILPARLIASILETEKTVSIPTEVINRVLSENPKAIEDYKKGKVSAIMFLVGQIMQLMKGKANAQDIKNLLEKRLK